MATVALQTPGLEQAPDEPARSETFAVKLAIAMALTVVAGFSLQLAMGRSTFGSPLRVHVHAFAFMGWVTIFLLQTYFATRGPLALHRKLGWVAAAWVLLMLGAAMTVIVVAARNGTIPFFFQPQLLLIGDPINLLAFAVLTYAAIVMRRRTDWHSRLHLGAMALLTAPALGRLLPLPLLIPWSFEAAGVATLVFPIAGMIRDRRVLGRIHPAWFVTVATFLTYTAAYEAVTYSPLGDYLYAEVTAGSHGAQVPGLAFPPPPAGPLVTGR